MRDEQEGKGECKDDFERPVHAKLRSIQRPSTREPNDRRTGAQLDARDMGGFAPCVSADKVDS